MRKSMTKFLAALLLLSTLLMVPSISSPVQAQEGEEDGSFTLTILHNNDGESQLVNAGSGIEDFGGVARFATLVSNLKTEATEAGHGVIMLSSGDNYLAGPEFNASRVEGKPFYDAVAVNLIGYDAMAIGNHEFDFGPIILTDFINSLGGSLPFVSANLDFSGEPSLQALVDQGVIVKSLTVSKSGQKIGIVGATTPQIPFISSPRNVIVDPDVAGSIQTEVDNLTAAGVDKIIVISHLQGVEDDLALASELSGVDVMIAGGGDELLANGDELLVPGDEEPYGAYPLTATTVDGVSIPVVTTPGDYKYVGKLVVTFDGEGNVTTIDQDSSGLVRVAGGDNPDAVEANAEIEAQVVAPVSAFAESLASNIIATSEVALEGRRNPGIRTMETNEGNLMADAMLWQANQLVGNFGLAPANVGLQNGGGIRNNNLIAAGDITELTTFDIAPFSNFVTLVQDIPADQFKVIMENAVSQVEDAAGRFAQISGFTMVYDPEGTAQVLADDGSVETEGSRVWSIVLDDGTAVVQDGAVVDGAPSINVATIDFLARGGDQYPFGEASFTPLGISYQQALNNYIVGPLEGSISAEKYPETGSGRITTVGMMAEGEDKAMADGEKMSEGEDKAMADGEKMAEGEDKAMADGEKMSEGEDKAMADGEKMVEGEDKAMADGEKMVEGEDKAMADGEMMAGCVDYTVQEGDWLSTIAEAQLGNVLAYGRIREATNAAAATNEAYATISDDNVIEPGQILCIPTTEGDEAAAPAASKESTETTTTTEETPAADKEAVSEEAETSAEEAMTTKTVVDVAAADERFTILVTALTEAGLVETLQGEGPFTVFAPTDGAFAALPDGTLDGLLEDIPALTEVLQYHVVGDKLLAPNLQSVDTLETIDGKTLSVVFENDSIMVGGAKVTIANIKADNGIIHAIDAVLLPSSEDGTAEESNESSDETTKESEAEATAEPTEEASEESADEATEESEAEATAEPTEEASEESEAAEPTVEPTATQEPTPEAAPTAKPDENQSSSPIAPPPGQTRVYLQNLYNNEYNIDFGDGSGTIQVPPETLTLFRDLEPGQYNPGISLPGGGATNLQLDLGVNESWAVILFEDGINIVAVQIYPEQ